MEVEKKVINDFQSSTNTASLLIIVVSNGTFFHGMPRICQMKIWRKKKKQRQTVTPAAKSSIFLSKGAGKNAKTNFYRASEILAFGPRRAIS